MLKAKGIKFEQQFRFSSKRKWPADFYIPCKKLLIEIEGGVWSKGRHLRPQGFINDCEKYNAATLLGYRVIRIPSDWFNKQLHFVDEIIDYILAD